jgi:hypothetical protein
MRTPSPFGAPTAALAEVFRPQLSFGVRFPVICSGLRYCTARLEKALLPIVGERDSNLYPRTL